MTDEEHYESIPWSTLMEADRSRRHRLVYLAAGALIVFAVAAIVARGLWTPEVATPPTTSREVPTTTLPAPVAAPVVAPVSEADLMAALDNESQRAAATFAEWFVYDYFTVDGDPANLASLADALPSGVPTELLPHGDTAVVTYVEWARAARVTETSPGRFEVLVLFRMVAGPPDGTFTRLATRAVVVPLEMGAGGGLRLIDLPAPATVPTRPAAPEWNRPVGPGSPEVAGAAIGLSWSGTGVEFEGLGAQRDGDSWRTLIRSTLPAGVGWPFVIEFPDELIVGQ